MSARALGVDAGVPAEAAAASACPPVTEARSQAEPASQAATHGPLAPDGGSTPPRHGQCRGGRDSHHTGSVCWRLRGMPGAPGSCLQIEPPGQGDLWERPLQHDPPPKGGGSQGRALPTARGTCAFSGPGSCGTGSVHSGRLNKPPRTDRPLATGRHAARKQHRGSLDAERGPRQDPDAPPRPCCLS